LGCLLLFYFFCDKHYVSHRLKKKKTHSNETMKPHFKYIYTRKLFLNCKLLTMSSLQIIKTCQL
jgi:hypothetical protein